MILRVGFYTDIYIQLHPGALQPEQIHNFELSKRCFSILNENFSFSRVDPNENEIMINTPSGEVYYEYLSSGFKSIISIVFELLKKLNYVLKSLFYVQINLME